MSDAQILIHLVFLNDGSVTRISEQPSGATPQKWFNHLSISASHAYQALSGGRGVFRLTAEELSQLKAPFVANHQPVA